VTIRIALTLCILLGSNSTATAQSGFYLPTGPSSSGQDEFHAADGTSCRTTMDGTKRLEVGSYGSGGDNLNSSNYPYNYNYVTGYGSRQPPQKNGGVYARFTMSLDASRSRMDCNKLYELEIERRRLEIELMKRNLVSSDQKLDDLKRRAPEPNPVASRPAKNQMGLRGGYPPL
jgi:hypothetical protein